MTPLDITVLILLAIAWVIIAIDRRRINAMRADFWDTKLRVLLREEAEYAD